MNKEIFETESIHLKSIVDKLNDANNVITEKLAALGKDNLDKLKDLREDPETSGLDFNTFIEQLHQENQNFNVKDKFKRLEEISFLVKEPYFARIDLQQEGDEKSFYIGKFGFTEKVPIITDWRAKVASVFYRYRYPQKGIKYDTPDGLVISDLNLKRTFEVDSGVLVKYFNNDLNLDESEIISEKIEKRTGGVLEDIVETIQESQLDIIESDPRHLTIVQGCVGSGKSTVAIHKLSHIFFNHPDLIHPERSILIAKNQILVGYLSTLFPKLGIFDINYKTLREVLINIVFREELQIRIDNLDTQSLNGFSEKDLFSIRNQLNKIHSKVENQLTKLFNNEDFESYGGYKYSQNYTPYENINDIMSDLEEELNNQQDLIKDNPKSIRAVFYRDNIRTIRRIITKLRKIKLELFNVDYVRFIKHNNIDVSKDLSYKDALIYVFAYLEIVGFTKFKKYEYCVVDEGQDFNLLEYIVLQKIVLHGRMCIFGDLNQGYVEEGVEKWEDISETISGGKKTKFFSLDTNYRSTKQIIDLANKILSPYTDRFLPKSINRIGKEPKLKDYSDSSQMLADLSTNIENDIKHLDKSIGLICMDETYYEDIKNILMKQNLEDDRLVELIPNQRISYLPKGVYFTKFENCKGLEFSKLYVVGLNIDKLNSFVDAKKAFVAITRAMNDLAVYYIK